MSIRRSSLTKLLILAVLLAVPGFLYYLLQEKGKNRYKTLPIYGQKEVASTFHTRRGKKIPDTLYHTIRDFKLINQDGDTVHFPADSSKVTVANFFYTSCPSFCKAMNTEMKRMHEKFDKNRLLHFVSISVDPGRDSADVLAKYARSFDARGGEWDMLTGDKELIYELARKDFLVDAFHDTSRADGFIHSPMLILIDSHKRIRGFYDSGRKESIDQLSDEIKVLITEELRAVKNR